MPTKIAWTDETWNVVIGCSHAAYRTSEGAKIAHPGCTNCYAERTCSRQFPAFEGVHNTVSVGGEWNGKVLFRRELLSYPFTRWPRRKTPRKVFVTSLGDMGHPAIEDAHWKAVQGAMILSRGNIFQDLTKRPEIQRKRLNTWSPLDCVDAYAEMVGDDDHAPTDKDGCYLPYPMTWGELKHIHRYVSVSDQATANALIPELLEMPAARRGVSYEPALGPVDLSPWLSRLDHVIVGGESGPGARPFKLEWARSVLKQCRKARVPCFVKQLERGNSDMATWPEDLRVQEDARL